MANSSPMAVKTMTSKNGQHIKNIHIKRVLTGVLLFSLEEFDDLLANLTLRHANIILRVTVVVHEREETVVGDIQLLSMSASRRSSNENMAGTTYKLVLAARDVGDIHVVG